MTKLQRGMWVLIFLAIGLVAMVIFVAVLGLVALLTLPRDKGLIAEAKQKIDKAFALMDVETADGGAISKDMVKKEIGQDPSSTTTDDNFEIETYEFNRALPFLQKPYLTVVYENGGLVQMIPNGPYVKGEVGGFVISEAIAPDPDSLPAAALSGPAPATDDGDDKEKDHPAADDK